MKSLSLVVLSHILAFGSVAAVVPVSSIKRITSLPVVPNQFIVEVQSTSDIPTSRSLDSPHEALYKALRARDVGFQVDKEYNSKGLFVGVALTLQNAQDAAKIAGSSGVVAIRPVTRIARPNPVFVHPVSNPSDAAIPADSESTHVMTGVDKLHAEGIFGKGVKIGIIDTGIDYTHPFLGAGFGPGFKVIGGYDFVGDAYDGKNTPVPDPDPLDQCAGHGTHVAGIIGANPGNPYNISGVAYESSLSSYRVFGCNGTVTDDILVEALLRGVQDGQDILTLSLGGPDGWTEGSASVVASRIAATGKIVTIAAGNDGAYGAWYSSGPGNGINVISCASVDNTVIPIQNATVHGVAHDPIPYFSATPLDISGELPIYATSNDTAVAADACLPLPDSTPDLSSYLVVVRRGGCNFTVKLANIAAKGGKFTFIYNNVPGFTSIDVGDYTAVLIAATDGAFLVTEFAAGANITLSFPQLGGSYNYPDPTGGLISTFTSYGPTNDFYFKPAVAAPGGNILSTYPVPLGTWAVLSGTSMATPFVAGSSALLFQVKGKSASVGRGARTLFETTASPVSSSRTDGDPLQTLAQQGAGLIQVYDAIHTTTIVSPGELILNDTAHYKGIQSFSIHNAGTTAKTFKLTHVPAGTAVTITAGDIFAADGPVPLTTAYATVVLSQKTVTVRPGQSQVITAVFTPPKGVDKTTFPVFSGFIQIASANETLHVSYLGLAAALKDKQVVDNTDEFFGEKLPALVDAAGDWQEGPTNYTFVNDDYPTLIARLAFGTPVLRVDLVSQNITLNSTLNRREVMGRDFFSFPHHFGSGTFNKVKIIGSLLESDFISRNSDAGNMDDNGWYSFALTPPNFANGTAIPNGSYRILLRALRVTGDPTKEEDYESWLSPIVGINV